MSSSFFIISAIAKTNARIVFLGTGEHIRDLEAFDANKFISRLLGMGDLGGLVAMAILVAVGSDVIFIPAAGICFFSGGTCGVCGYAYGGWKGALLGSFLVGIFLCAGCLVLYPAFADLGIADASFPNVDYNIVGSIIYGIGSIFA